MKRVLLIIVIGLFVLGAKVAEATVYLDLQQDAEVYFILKKLEAMGYIKSSMLTTAPLSVEELKRLLKEAESRQKEASPLVREMIGYLKSRYALYRGRFIKPLDRAYVDYGYLNRSSESFNYNNEGYNYQKGSNTKVGFTSILEIGPSIYLNPEWRNSDSGSEFILHKAYAVVGLGNFDIIIGKDSQWWGPAEHGAVLLSSNPEPFTMIRLTNPRPVLLPWVFKRLGLFRFSFFVTKLEKERYVPEPYLWGLRLNFKPMPWFEFALSRTAMLGGQGRSESLETWWKSFTAKGENEPGKEAGDQRAGFDIKLTLPFKVQPVQLYLEAAGEDEAGGLPYRWAYIAGLYLPTIGRLEQLSLRLEYATTHVPGSPNVWYRHHIYRSGYTYEGRIIGHHIGTDAEDIFTSVTWAPSPDRHLSVFYEFERYNLSDPSKEEKQEVGFQVWRPILGKNLFYKLHGRYTLNEHKNSFLVEGIIEVRL